MKIKDEYKVGLIVAIFGIILLLVQLFFGYYLFSGAVALILGIFVMVHAKFKALGSGLYFIAAGAILRYLQLGFVSSILGTACLILGAVSLLYWFRKR